MDLDLSTRSAHSYGGNTTYGLVGQYVASGLGDYGPAVRLIEVIACFRGGDVEHPSLQRGHDEYHAGFLPSLPRAKYFRKKARFELLYETHAADASFLERFGCLSLEVFAQVLAELADALHLMDGRLKASDAFDLSRFHQDIERIVEASPRTDVDLRALHNQIEQREKARRDAMDPWERLAIDWEEYHPAARQLLNEPFLWSIIDDYSPHGNDTGADLLSEFTVWNRRHPSRPAHEMAQKLLRAWGIAPIDCHATERAAVLLLLREDPIALSTTDDAIIAAAFAALKLRGTCDPDSRDLALKAIERERLPEVIDDRGWSDPSECLQYLDALARVLRQATGARSSR